MTLMNWPEMASTGEAILFGCVAVFMIACALGVLFFKKAVHCAICMVGVMLGLAILYLMHGAAFLGTVQVVVYTGAIMVLFLFVIMMIGLGASDNYAQQARAHHHFGAHRSGLGSCRYWSYCPLASNRLL